MHSSMAARAARIRPAHRTSPGLDRATDAAEALAMSTPPPSTAALFLEFSREKLLRQYWPRMKTCIESLTDEQIWWRPNASSNSAGNLLLHLNGNVRQWLVASFNHQPDL